MKRLKPPRPAWTSWEVCVAAGDGSWTDLPVAGAMAAGGDLIGTAINKMRLLEQLGVPDAHKTLEIDKADDKSPTIFILKCKPSCWRLYFYVHHESDSDKRFIYLHAKCKKKNRRSKQDSKHARNLLADVLAQRSRIKRFVFPAD